jgi:predicted GIY-YIG superfamily endonuclease
MDIRGIVYKLTNKLNGKVYVGQTKNTVERRVRSHVKTKRSLIGKAIRKYGIESFEISIEPWNKGKPSHRKGVKQGPLNAEQKERQRIGLRAAAEKKRQGLSLVQSA